MTYLKAFTTLLQNFVDELSNMFPDEKDLKVYSSYTASMIALNPRLVHKYFVQFVYPFKNQIEKREEGFFLNKDYTEEIKEVGQGDMLQAMKLKQLWHVMSPESKDNTWKYFEGLIKLSEKA